MTNHKSKTLSRTTPEPTELTNMVCENSRLSLPLDYYAPAPLRRTRPNIVLDDRMEGTQAILESMVPSANEELAALLRDVNKESEGPLAEGGQGKAWQELLRRAVRCATQQHSLQAELGNLALTDELTGLYNRRGFLLLAERQLKLARRTHRGLLLFFMDLDGLKRINDRFGHAEGDRALTSAAEALTKTFRESDVLARFGGDEFAALAIEASDFSEKTIRNRLDKQLRAISAHSGSPVLLSLGSARFEPRNNTSLQELMAKADHAMYAAKQGESRTRSCRSAGNN